MDQLGTIVSVLGTSELHAYISKYNIEKTPEIRKVIAKYTLRGRGPPQKWDDLVRKHLSVSDDDQQQQQPAPSPGGDSSEVSSSSSSSSSTTTSMQQQSWPSRDGIDLLSRLLIYDHRQRLTARQAMEHAFFDPVRERVEAEVRYFNNYRLMPQQPSSSSTSSSSSSSSTSPSLPGRTSTASTAASVTAATKRGGGR